MPTSAGCFCSKSGKLLLHRGPTPKFVFREKIRCHDLKVISQLAAKLGAWGLHSTLTKLVSFVSFVPSDTNAADLLQSPEGTLIQAACSHCLSVRKLAVAKPDFTMPC